VTRSTRHPTRRQPPTGTVIGCILAEDGDLDHHGVLARLQELRAGTGKATRSSPETPAQVEIIRARVSDRRPT
jgi:hypothetical protein